MKKGEYNYNNPIIIIKRLIYHGVVYNKYKIY